MSEIRVNTLGNESNTGGPVLSGITTFSGQKYFIPPKGTTEERPSGCPAGSIRFNTDSAHLEYYNGLVWLEFEASSVELGDHNASAGESRAGTGARGIFGGGEQPSVVATIDYISISTLGNAADFGDLSSGARRNQASTSDRSRLIFTGGYTPSSPNYYNEAQFVTVASTGNTSDFGDLTVARSRHTGFGSQTRGFAAGGLVSGSPGRSDVIDYCTIQSAGNFVDFGNLGTAVLGTTGSQSPTRGLIFGGKDGSNNRTNAIEFVTMATLGNTQDFGDLSFVTAQGTAGSNATRAIAGAGFAPSLSKAMEYVTIATLGNGTTFGDLTQNRIECGGGACSSTRIVIPGSFSSNNVVENEIDYAEIATTGNFIDFGDMTAATNGTSGGSNAHGGL